MQVKVALCQLAVTADKQANLHTAERAIADAAGNGAQLVVLPEMWNCPYSNDSFPTYAEDVEGGDSPSAALLAGAAKKNQVVLRMGVASSCGPPRSALIFKSSLVVLNCAPSGQLLDYPSAACCHTGIAAAALSRVQDKRIADKVLRRWCWWAAQYQSVAMAGCITPVCCMGGVASCLGGIERWVTGAGGVVLVVRCLAGLRVTSGRQCYMLRVQIV